MKKAVVLGSILCGGQWLSYELVQKPVKNINIHVRADGMIIVSANRCVPISEVERVLWEKSEFLLHALEQLKKKQALAPPPHQYADGEHFRIFGRLLTLQTAAAPQVSVFPDEKTLLLSSPQPLPYEQRRYCISQLLNQECTSAFQKAIQEAAVLLADRPIPSAVNLRIRRMTSRWGSCIPAKKIITLSTRLLETPWPCVQAVALHEYVHFLHADHSAAFYSELERAMPDYRQRTRPLRALPYSFFYNE